MNQGEKSEEWVPNWANEEFDEFSISFSKKGVFSKKIYKSGKKALSGKSGYTFLIFWLRRSQGVILTQLDELSRIIIRHVTPKREEWVPNGANEESYEISNFSKK